MILFLCEVVVIGLFLIYMIFPLILYLCPEILSKIIFLNFVYLPSFTDLSNPNKFGFNHKNWRNIKIENKYSHIDLGAWEILCNEDEICNVDDLEEFSKIFSNGRPIIMYFHGNSMHRGSSHRVKLYHILRESGYHLIAVDYRGFADSSGSVHDENEVLEDVFVTYNYVKRIAPTSPLFVWGHSLGTGISSLLLNKLSEIDGCSSINGLILESPFTCISEVMDHIRLSIPWRWLPFFNLVFKQSLIDRKLNFNSNENLKNVNVPILILHAQDDKVISFKLGQKLFTNLQEAGKDVYFKSFPSTLKFGHKYIIHYPELPNLIREFTSGAINRKARANQ